MEDQSVTIRVKYLADASEKYPENAYYAVLDTVGRCIASSRRTRNEHITGQELSEEFASLMLEFFGPMAIDVLDFWHVKSTEDIGEMVFELVSVNLLALSPTDSIEDFKQVYSFKEKFIKPFTAKGPYPDLPLIIHNED